MRILPILPIVLVGILLGLFLADVGKAQTPAAFPLPTEVRDPFWNSINIEDHGGTVTPVVSFPQDSVIVFVS